MRELLDNKLIRKYLGHEPCGHANDNWVMCDNCLCREIISAMWVPVRKGDAYLDLAEGNILFKIRNSSDDLNSDRFHPYTLHLPERFRPKPVEPQPEKIERTVCADDIMKAWKELDRLMQAVFSK